MQCFSVLWRWKENLVTFEDILVCERFSRFHPFSIRRLLLRIIPNPDFPVRREAGQGEDQIRWQSVQVCHVQRLILDWLASSLVDIEDLGGDHWFLVIGGNDGNVEYIERGLISPVCDVEQEPIFCRLLVFFRCVDVDNVAGQEVLHGE